MNGTTDTTISNSPIKDPPNGAIIDHLSFGSMKDDSVQALGAQAVESLKELLFSRRLSTSPNGVSGDSAPGIIKPAQNGPKASSTPKFFLKINPTSTSGAPSQSPRKAEKRGAGNLSSDDLT